MTRFSIFAISSAHSPLNPSTFELCMRAYSLWPRFSLSKTVGWIKTSEASYVDCTSASASLDGRQGSDHSLPERTATEGWFEVQLAVAVTVCSRRIKRDGPVVGPEIWRVAADRQYSRGEHCANRTTTNPPQSGVRWLSRPHSRALSRSAKDPAAQATQVRERRGAIRPWVNPRSPATTWIGGCAIPLNSASHSIRIASPRNWPPGSDIQHIRKVYPTVGRLPAGW